MTRTKRNTGAGEAGAGTPANLNDMEWGGFINVRMSDEDKTAFRFWANERDSHMWVDFQELVSRGFKFGLSYDPVGDFYLATFTAGGAALIGIDARCCLTARAPGWEESISLLIFKHEVLAKGNWGTFRPKTMRFDNFG